MRTWLLRAALLTWPADLRERHGRALAQTVAAAWTDRSPGAARDRRLWPTTAALVDVALAGLAERRRRRTGTVRATSGGHMTASFRSDLRLALRALARRPPVTAAVVATLALGLGATVAMFSVINAVLLRPLPFSNDHELVMLTERHTTRPQSGVSFAAFKEWQQLPGLASLAAYELRPLTFRIDGAPQRFEGAEVSPAFFSTLGVAAAMGRTPQPGDPLIDPSPKMMLGHELWMRAFGGDAGIIGRALTIDRTTYEIVAVLPPSMDFPAGSAFWTTLPTGMTRIVDSRDLRFLSVVGRLDGHAGVRDLDTRLRAWAAGRPADPEDRDAGLWRPEAVSMKDAAVAGVRRPLAIVFGGVSLLLLVACANVAALVMAHGRSRLRDFAVQASLGAGRGRLVQQLMLEGLLLSLAGSAAALLVATAARDGIVALSLNQIPRLDRIVIDVRVLAFVLTAGIATTLLVALGPALALTRGSHAGLLQRASRTTAGSAGGHRFFSALVTIEFALALALVAGAGLLANSYVRLRQVDTGIQPAGVGVARITLPSAPQWRGDDRLRRFYDDLRERVGALPGMESVAIVTRLPLETTRGSGSVWPEGDHDRQVQGLIQVASEHYLETIGARLSDGRDFTDRDVAGNPTVVVINDVLAAQLWPAERAVGRTIEFQYLAAVKATVIGVVHALRYDGLTSEPRPEVYLSFRQGVVLPMYLVYRTNGSPLSAVPGVRTALALADPTSGVTLDDISTLDAKFALVVARPRFYLVLVASFATIAFLLAAVGIHGTLSFWASERRREMGIRLALGAAQAQIRSLIVTRGLLSAGIGVVLGLSGTLLTGRFTAALLFGVSPADPLTLTGAAAGLLAVAALACLPPARRATRVNPLEVLRAE